MSSHACSLCGLRYPAQSLLDLHIREDHARRDDKPAAAAAPAAPAASAAPADTPAPPPSPSAPGTERLSWAETARRALNRMMGKEPTDPPHRAA
jgi:hypothetical protein